MRTMMRGIGALFVAFLCQAAHGATWYVDGSVSQSGDGSDESPFKKIQEGIDAATHADTVIVAQGTYLENIKFNGKNIVLTSTDPTDPSVVANTIIDGNKAGSVVTFSGTETEGCVLSGFTMRNGKTSGSGGGICGGDPTYTHATIENNTITGNSATDWGGGLYYCSGTIQNNTITGNSAGFGGGLAYCDGTIQKNTITGNSAVEYGGGLAYCDGTIQNNTITGNSAVWTGGGLSDCDGTIQNNAITGNSAGNWGGGLGWCDGRIQNNTIAGNSATDWGGGLYYCNGTIQNNTITGNSANFTGGLSDCNGTIQNNTITENSAGDSAGGLGWCDGRIQNNTIAGNSANRDGGGVHRCYGTIENNTITGNSAGFGGGLNYCGGTIRNNTITGNSAGYAGGGLRLCNGAIQNCIIWGNTAPTGPQLHQSSMPTYSCIQDWTGGGEANIAGDPKFVDADGPDDDPATYEDNNYRLSADSPCIDKGLNEDWMLDATDLDRNPRIANGKVDMGAFEFQRRPGCIITAEGDVATLKWGDFGNGSYTVEWRDDLLQGAWQPAAGNWPIGELMWNDILTKQMMQRFYRVESAGTYTNAVGFMRVLAVDAGLTLLSVPLAPADNRLNGEPGCIGDILKQALTGGTGAGDADVVFKWNPKTQSYRTAYIVAGVDPDLDGKWWDAETGTLSTMTLDVGECFWALRRSRQGTSP